MINISYPLFEGGGGGSQYTLDDTGSQVLCSFICVCFSQKVGGGGKTFNYLERLSTKLSSSGQVTKD